MKNILIKLYFFVLLFSINYSFSQSSIQMNHISPAFLVPNDSIFVYFMNPGDPTNINIIDIKNVSAVSHTYSVIKREIVINPSGAAAYFCFGNLYYSSFTYTASSQITLAPGQSASSMIGPCSYFSPYFDEGTLKAYSYIKYTIYDKNNLVDSVRVGFKFNPLPLDVKNKVNSLEYFSAKPFPNPNNGSFKLQIDNEISEGEMIIYNSLGQKVHEQKIISGENNIITNNLPRGLYHYSLLQNKQLLQNGKIVVE